MQELDEQKLSKSQRFEIANSVEAVCTAATICTAATVLVRDAASQVVLPLPPKLSNAKPLDIPRDDRKIAQTPKQPMPQTTNRLP